MPDGQRTVYLDAILDRIAREGSPVLGADVARLSPYPCAHINAHGHDSFTAPHLHAAGSCVTPALDGLGATVTQELPRRAVEPHGGTLIRPKADRTVM